MKQRMRKIDFARLLGASPSYVTKLKDQGLLVLDGKLVDVEATHALIAAATGRRPDVATRWVEQRQAARQGPQTLAPVPTPTQPSPNPLATPSGQPAEASMGAGQGDDNERQAERNDIALRKARAAMQREEAQAEQERMKAAQMRGDLIPKDQVELAFKSLAAVVRSGIETQPDQLAPLIAPVSDVQSVQSILVDAHRNLLTNLSDATRREAERLAREARDKA